MSPSTLSEIKIKDDADLRQLLFNSLNRIDYNQLRRIQITLINTFQQTQDLYDQYEHEEARGMTDNVLKLRNSYEELISIIEASGINDLFPESFEQILELRQDEQFLHNFLQELENYYSEITRKENIFTYKLTNEIQQLVISKDQYGDFPSQHLYEEQFGKIHLNLFTIEKLEQYFNYKHIRDSHYEFRINIFFEITFIAATASLVAKTLYVASLDNNILFSNESEHAVNIIGKMYYCLHSSYVLLSKIALILDTMNSNKKLNNIKNSISDLMSRGLISQTEADKYLKNYEFFENSRNRLEYLAARHEWVASINGRLYNAATLQELNDKISKVSGSNRAYIEKLENDKISTISNPNRAYIEEEEND